MDLIDLCRHAISIDSTPSHGTREIMEWAGKLAQDLDFDVEYQNDFLGDLEQLNLVIRPHSNLNSSECEFLFQAHLDSVEPGPFQLWRDNFQNPFGAVIKDEKIFGLGAADGKIDFLCKLEALTHYRQVRSFRETPVLVATYGAHLGMVGALKLIRRKSVNPRRALIGETTSLNLVTSAPGLALIEIQIPFSETEISRRRQHENLESVSTQSKLFTGSIEDVNHGAVRKMLEYLTQLPDNIVLIQIEGGANATTVPTNAFLELDLTATSDSVVRKISSIYLKIKHIEQEFLAFQNPLKSPPYPVINIGLIRTLEDHIQILISCKLPSVIGLDVYEGWISKMKEHCESLESSFRIVDYKKPFDTDETSEFVRGSIDILRAQNANLDETFVDGSFGMTNEASLFSRLGIECICFGPGLRSGNVHTPQEHVLLGDIPRAISFYKGTVERFCL